MSCHHQRGYCQGDLKRREDLIVESCATKAPPGSHASSGPQQPIQQPSTTTNPTIKIVVSYVQHTQQVEPGATQQSQAPPRPPARTNGRPKLDIKGAQLGSHDPPTENVFREEFGLPFCFLKCNL